MASHEDTQRGEEKARLAKELLAEACEKEGLDAGYWLPKLSEILGVNSREALKHLQYEDYLKLECEVRYPWETKALQNLLELTDKRAASEDTAKERQEAAKLLLKELKEMHDSHSHSKDAVRQKEEALWKAMGIPRESWAPPENSVMEVLGNTQKQLEQQESSVGRAENISDAEVLMRASGGLALQGIYLTRRTADVLAKREQLIRVPSGFRLAGPEQGSLFDRKEFSSSAAEATFTKSMEQLGFSISSSARTEFWGFSVEMGVDYSKSSRSEDTHRSCSEQSYICTTKYRYIPLASCNFQKHQLRLSDAALRELQHIEHLLSITEEADRPDMLKSRCGSFFERFGSHVMQGPLHFGGIFWWKASMEGFRAEHREETKRQVSKALDSYVGASSGIFGGSADVSKSSSQAFFQGTDRKNVHTNVHLYVTNTGGPSETDSLPQWKAGLVSSNRTWSVIDRGSQLIPVWDIIQSNHSSDFKSSYQVSSSLRAAYAALTNLRVETMFGEELDSAVEEARAFMERVKAWEVPGDESKLLALIDFQQRLNEKTKSHSVWINVCLSDKALQEFLLNTVQFYQKSPPENTTYIKSLLRCLLDPHSCSVEGFPRSSLIMQWIEDTEDVFQSIEPSSQSKSKSDGSEPKANPAIGNHGFPCLLQRLIPECHSPRIMETEDVHDESNPGLSLVPKRSELEREHSNVFDHFLRLSQWILFPMNYTLARNIIWLTKILDRFRQVIREDLGEFHSAVQKLKEINQSHLEIVKQDGNQCKLEERRSEHEKELLARSKALALHPEGQSLSERELRDNFRSLWAKQITAAPPPEQVNIDVQIENVLVDHFKKRELYERIRKFPKHPQFSVDLEKHVAKKRKRRGLTTESLDNADVNSIHRITDNIIAKVWANIDKKEKEKRDFSPSFIHEILNEVKKGMNSVPDNAKYRFSKDYRIDLSLYLCRMAAGRFKAMHEAFQRANDPIFYM